MKDLIDGMKSDTNAVENIRLIPVVYSQEALDCHSGQRSDRTVPIPATTAQGSSGSLTVTVSESFHRLTLGDPLSHI